MNLIEMPSNSGMGHMWEKLGELTLHVMDLDIHRLRHLQQLNILEQEIVDMIGDGLDIGLYRIKCMEGGRKGQ